MIDDNDINSDDDMIQDIEDSDILEDPVKKTPNPHKKSRRGKSTSTSRGRKKADALIRRALEHHLEYQAIKSQGERKDMELLGSIIEEYLDNYIILGYNYHGEQVQLISASNQQHADALGTCIHRFIMKSSAHGGPGGDMFI